MLETYAITQELNIWTSSSVTGRAVYDHRQQRWTIVIDHNGVQVTLHPAHIVLATGTLGAPQIPQMDHREFFPGMVIHGSQFKEPSPYKGKNVVVVGAGNSSVDICQDLAEGGAASVTMIQRSPMCVAGRDTENIRIGTAFSPDYPVEINDFKVASIPRIYLAKQMMTKEFLDDYWGVKHKDVVDKVEKGGFVVRKDKPQFVHLLERLGGELCRDSSV